MNYTIGMKVFGNWEIKEELGEGSYGKVFKIQKEQAGITASAALKVMRIPKSASDVKKILHEGMDERSATTYFKGYVNKLMQEIAIMSTLKGHPGIVSCENYELIPHSGSIGWDILIQMELLTPLLDYQAEHPMDEVEVRRLGREICSALVYCHLKRGIIHRDIKPSNILVSESGQFKLGDFGVSKTVEGTVGFLSRQGTDGYMAPEVYLNKPYGTSVDIYSLGLVLYQMMNGGRLPFYPPISQQISFDDREKALTKRMQGAKMLPPVYASEEFAEVILKACAYNQKDRYRNASEFLEALENVKIEKRVQKEKGQEDIPPQSAVGYVSNEDKVKTRGPFDRMFEEEQENEGEGEDGTRGIFNQFPLAGEEGKAEDEESEEKLEEKVVPSTPEKIEKKREDSKKIAIIAIAAVLVLVVGIKLISGSGKAETKQPTNNTPVAQDEQDTNNDVSQEEANQNLTEEEKWQNVYEKVYSSLKDGEYDFTELTFEEYSELLLEQGYMYQKGLYSYAKEVTEKQYGDYRAIAEEDINKQGKFGNVFIEMSTYPETGGINILEFTWGPTEFLYNNAKICPEFVWDYKDLKKFCDKVGITEEMLQNCEKSVGVNQMVMTGAYSSADMEVLFQFPKSSKEHIIDDINYISFQFKNEAAGNIMKVSIGQGIYHSQEDEFYVRFKFKQ